MKKNGMGISHAAFFVGSIFYKKYVCSYFQNEFEVRIWLPWYTPNTNCINHCLTLNIALWFSGNQGSSYPRKKGQQHPCPPHFLLHPTPGLSLHTAPPPEPRPLCLNLISWKIHMGHYLYGNVFKFSNEWLFRNYFLQYIQTKKMCHIR